jgi:hypothetical protein
MVMNNMCVMIMNNDNKIVVIMCINININNVIVC